jgi:hypothetical protein
MQQKILLATTVNWPSTARLAGAFATLGASVEAVLPKNHVCRRSRYLDKAHDYSPLGPQASMAQGIAASVPDLVIPCDDRALSLLLALSEFEFLLTRSLGPMASYAVLTARAPSIAAARQEGIAAPLTLAVADLEALPGALAQTGLPCVMKADGSWGGEGVKFVRTPDEAALAFRKLQGPPSRLRSLARAVLRKDMHFIGAALAPRQAAVNVQAFVPGKPATSVYACRNGNVLAALHMDVIDWAGATGPAARMRRVRDPYMDAAARKLAARFHLNGLQGLDFVRDESGQPHLIEINPRATQICHLALGSDLPAALLGTKPRPAATGLDEIATFPQLLSKARSPSVYEDIPWDDPGVLKIFMREGMPDILPELTRPEGLPPALGRKVYEPGPR